MHRRQSYFRPLTLSIRARESLIKAIVSQLEELELCDTDICELHEDDAAQYLDLCSILIALKSSDGKRFLDSYNSRRES